MDLLSSYRLSCCRSFCWIHSSNHGRNAFNSRADPRQELQQWRGKYFNHIESNVLFDVGILPCAHFSESFCSNVSVFFRVKKNNFINFRLGFRLHFVFKNCVGWLCWRELRKLNITPLASVTYWSRGCPTQWSRTTSHWLMYPARDHARPRDH